MKVSGTLYGESKIKLLSVSPLDLSAAFNLDGRVYRIYKGQELTVHFDLECPPKEERCDCCGRRF